MDISRTSPSSLDFLYQLKIATGSFTGYISIVSMDHDEIVRDFRLTVH
jgi:hypothetical protein